MGEILMPEVGALSHQGMRREKNEDRLAVPPPDLSAQLVARKGYLYIVADGMGGHRAGDKASEIAAATAMKHYYADPSTDAGRSLKAAIEEANAEVHRQGLDPAHAGMGTTIVAAVIQPGWLTVAHVGDSRAYVLGRDGLRRVTQDHSWTAALVRDGLITEEQSEQHPQRHKLTQALGLRPEVEVEVKRAALGPGDQVLLCSDGLWDVVPERQIQEDLRKYPPQMAAQRLVSQANSLGGPDNITLIAIRPQPWPGASALSPQSPGTRNRWMMALGIAAAFLILVGLSALAVRVFGDWMLPTMPAPKVEPVRYTLQPGDTREALAQYFQVPIGGLPDDLTAGDNVPITPGGYGILLGGQVLSMREDQGRRLLSLASRSREDGTQRDVVEIDLMAGEAMIDRDRAPRKGDRVAVFGSRRGDGTIDAAFVDVSGTDGWYTWYVRPQASPMWVYTAYDESLLPAPGLEDEGKRVLVRGTWTRGPTAMDLSPEAEDVFLLKDEVYSPVQASEERRSLAQRFGPTAAPIGSPTVAIATPEPVAAATQPPTEIALTPMPSAEVVGPEPTEGLAVQEPTVAKAPTEATLQPTATSILNKAIEYKVELRVLQIYEGASKNSPKLEVLSRDNDDAILVHCWMVGEWDPKKDSDLWYLISKPHGLTGYAFSGAMGTFEQQLVPECD